MAAKGQHAVKIVRRQKAVDLAMAGASYRQIGQQLGVSMKTAWYDVQDALAETDALTKVKAERLKELELRRLNKMTLALQPKVQSGDEKAIRALVLIMDRRAKLTGIDAPTKVDATLDGDIKVTLHDAHERLAGKLARLAASRPSGVPGQPG